MTLGCEPETKQITPTSKRIALCVVMGTLHTRFIQNGLCELRVKSKEGIARVLFCTKIGKRIIMLHIFIKKSRKTPKRELKIAFERLKEVI